MPSPSPSPSRPPAALRRFVAGISLLSAIILLALGVAHGREALTAVDEYVIVLGLVVVLAEFVSIRLSRSGEFTTATLFTFTLLWTHGVTTAVLVQALASIVADIGHRKPPGKILFNVGQYTISWAAAGAVLDYGLGYGADGGGLRFAPSDLPAFVLAGAVFCAINHPLASIAPALAARARIREFLVANVAFELGTTAILIGFSPIVVVVIGVDLRLIPLLLLPLVAVYVGGRAAVRTEHQALHDGLTGLPNRVLFRQELERALEHGAPGVLMMDLDRFKEVNDALGHAHGDLLLDAVSRRLAPALLDDELLARLGGDEFAVLVPGATDERLAELTERLLQAVRAPFPVDGLALEVGTSIGAAFAPADGSDADTLMKRAELAMYAAKERRCGWLRYDPGMDDRTPAQLLLVGELRQAIEAGELTLHYQPKLGLEAGRVGAVEALVRWPHAQRGMVSPGEFIPLAEHTGLIRPLTDLVLEQAVAQIAAWNDAGTILAVAVNVSSRSLLDERFAHEVAAVLERHGVSAAQLELEITESVLMTDPAKAEAVLNQLADLGVGLSIDDFGTGYSSLGYLKRLPVDTLKIDQSFVRDMMQSRSDHAIVASTITLSRNLGLTVVAEGVEDDDTMLELRRLGCHVAQGYGIARPLAAEPLGELLAAGVRIPDELREPAAELTG